MEAMKFTTRVGEDGLVQLRLPAEMSNHNIQVLIHEVYEEEKDISHSLEQMTQAEWAARIDALAGALVDDPIERGEQLPVDVRDEIE